MNYDCSNIGQMTHEEAFLIISLLNETGIVSDEDGTILGSTRIEHCATVIEEQLRSHGYQGGPLSVTAKFYDDQGAIYVIYDEDHHDLSSARNYLDRYVQNVRKNISVSNP